MFGYPTFLTILACHVSFKKITNAKSSTDSGPVYKQGASRSARIVTDWAWASTRSSSERADLKVSDISSDAWCSDYKVCTGATDDVDVLKTVITELQQAVLRMETKNDKASFAGLAHRDLGGNGVSLTDYGWAIASVAKDVTGISSVQRKVSRQYKATKYNPTNGDQCIKKYGKGSRRCSYDRTPEPTIYDIVENMSVEAQKFYQKIMDEREYDDEVPIEH